MIKVLTGKVIEKRKLLFFIVPLVLVLAILVNSVTIKSFPLGFLVLSLYLAINGEFWGNFFLREENHFFRFTFGLMLEILVIVSMGILAILLFQIENWYFLGLIFATIAALIMNFLPRRDNPVGEYHDPEEDVEVEKTSLSKRLYAVPLFGLYISLFAVSFFILLTQRSGWIPGPIWNVVPPIFLQLFFAMTAVLVGILLLPGRFVIKLLLICLHYIFSLSLLVILLYPGIIWYDPWIDLARARIASSVVQWLGSSVSGMGFFRVLNNIMRGFSLFVMPPIIQGALNIDLYWIYVLFMPLMWGFFVPLISYKITRMMGGDRGASIMASFLTTVSLLYLAWGKLTAGNSFGNLLFLFGLYLILRFLSVHGRAKFRQRFLLIFVPIGMIFLTLATTHFLPTLMFISAFALAFGLNKYENIHQAFSKRAYFLLSSATAFAVLLLPAAVIGRGIVLPMLGTSALSVNQLFSTSVWTFVFGIPEEYGLKAAMLNESLQLIGVIGFIYAFRRSDKFSKTPILFLFLVFAVAFIDYRILNYAMVYAPYHIFAPSRLHAFREMAVIPLAAIALNSALMPLFSFSSKKLSLVRVKDLMVGMLVILVLSAWSTAAIFETYQVYTAGLLATSLEVEVIKYIDEHTDRRYVVLAPVQTAVIGWGFVGLPNFAKYYVVNKVSPSVGNLVGNMSTADADIGYFIVSSFRSASFDKTNDQASRLFGLFKVLSNENGQVYVYYFKVPPLPTGPEVTAYYWETPPAYHIQNDLVRVKIDIVKRTLSVEDFWGDLYEGLELDGALVDGRSVGNLTAIEYLDSTTSTWNQWDPYAEIPSSSRFDFRLRFENDYLLGAVESGEASIQLSWQSGQASTLSLSLGGHTRFYIPGLVGVNRSSEVYSRKYGFLYTESLTDNVLLYPAYGSGENRTFLAFDDIKEDCGFYLPKLTSPEGYMWYDLFVHNIAGTDQWAFIEARLPDTIYIRTFPPFRYSTDDGATWVYAPYSAETRRSDPVVTVGGAEVNWIMSRASNIEATPTMWVSYEKAVGGFAYLPENFTDSGGAENKIIYGFYLPAGDKILVRLGASIYWVRPLEVSYAFKDSEDVDYGLQNMEEYLIRFYSSGSSQYVGGFASTNRPTSLVVTQDETNKLNRVTVTIPANTAFSLLSSKEVNTLLDQNGNGVPDNIESL